MRIKKEESCNVLIGSGKLAPFTVTDKGDEFLGLKIKQRDGFVHWIR